MIPTTNVWGTKWFFDIQKLNTESSDVKVKWFWFLSDCSTAEKECSQFLNQLTFIMQDMP